MRAIIILKIMFSLLEILKRIKFGVQHFASKRISFNSFEGILDSEFCLENDCTRVEILVALFNSFIMVFKDFRRIP